jgi:hypothetical protein
LGNTTRGRREGWLTRDGLERICAPMRPARQDQAHFGSTPLEDTSAHIQHANIGATKRSYLKGNVETIHRVARDAWRAVAKPIERLTREHLANRHFQQHFKPISNRL